MADKSSTQASKPRTLTVDDQDRDFLKQIQELNVKGNEKLKEIQQDPTLSWKDPAEQIDTILANSEAAVEQYNKVIKSSQEALSAVTTANSAIRLKEREKTAFLVAEVQFDVELMGHDVEADTEKLRRIFKAKPFLLKALDTESANDIRKDVEEQLRRSQERIDKAWRRVADLEDPEFKAYNKRYEVSFQEELSKVNAAAREALQKLEGDVHALELIRGDLRNSVRNVQAENARLFEKAASSEQLNEKVAAMQKQVQKLEEDLENSSKAKVQLIKNHSQNTDEMILEHNQIVSDREDRFSARIAARLEKQKERLEEEYGELKTSHTKTIAGLQAELEGEKRTVVSLQQQLVQKDVQMDLLLQQSGQELAKVAQKVKDELTSALSGVNERLQKVRSNLPVQMTPPTPNTRLTRTYSDAHGPGNADDDRDEVRPPPARRPVSNPTTRRSAIPIRSQNLTNVVNAAVGSAASYRPRSSVKLGVKSIPRPVRPQHLSQSPEGQEEDLESMNEISQSLIDQMVLPANWTESDTEHMQQIFCQYQDAKMFQTQPQPALDWCAKAADGGSGTCWYQKVLRHKAQFETVDITQPCSHCKSSKNRLCVHVKWANDKQKNTPYDSHNQQKRWIIEKRSKADETPEQPPPQTSYPQQ